MIHRLRITAAVASRLRAHHLAEGKRAEAISLAMGHAYASADGEVTVVLSDPGALYLFGDDCYDTRGFAHASLSRDVRAAVCWQAVQSGYTAIVDIHDHHFAGDAQFSGVDDRDDRNTARFFEQTLPRFLEPGRRMFSAALLLARDEWAARIVHAGDAAPAMAEMRIDIVGDPWRQPGRAAPPVGQAAFGRQRAVIPTAAQALLAGAHAVLIGCGGTGSIAAETLIRLGVGQITLVDNDTVESSNLHRFQGGVPADVGRHKVSCVAQRLRVMWPSARVDAIASQVFDRAAIARLEQADFIVGCLDNAETRWWLNRFAVQYMVPYFDCGVLIETEPALVMRTRVSVVIPGAGPCGHCSPLEFFPRQRPRQFLDAATLAAERSAGYVQDTPSMQADPAIYPLNQLAVSGLARELIAWVTGAKPVAHSLCHRDDSQVTERIELVAFGGGGADDCPLCAYLAGRCREHELPAVDDDVQLSLPGFTTEEPDHGQIQS